MTVSVVHAGPTLRVERQLTACGRCRRPGSLRLKFLMSAQTQEMVGSLRTKSRPCAVP
jgi:hypothetical protein